MSTIGCLITQKNWLGRYKRGIKEGKEGDYGKNIEGNAKKRGSKNRRWNIGIIYHQTQ